MTAPTHVAFGLFCASMAGIENSFMKFVAVGALLPDIDHPQAAIGRVFFFISYPFNKLFGHRRHIHSIIIYVPLGIAGYFVSDIMMYVAAGALSHCVIDCVNTSGVYLLMPVSEKLFVLFSRRYRLCVGSRDEFIILIVLTMLSYGSYRTSMHGGLRAIMATVIGSYDMAYSRYMRQSNSMCEFAGKFRHSNGHIEEGTWKVIGTEGGNGLAVYKERLLHIPDDGKFLKVKLIITDVKWNTLNVSRPSKLLDGDYVFFKVGKNGLKEKRVNLYLVRLFIQVISRYKINYLLENSGNSNILKFKHDFL